MKNLSTEKYKTLNISNLFFVIIYNYVGYQDIANGKYEPISARIKL